MQNLEWLGSVKDMAEMRKGILSMDPEFLGTTDITNPDTDQVIQ